MYDEEEEEKHFEQDDDEEGESESQDDYSEPKSKAQLNLQADKISAEEGRLDQVFYFMSQALCFGRPSNWA